MKEIMYKISGVGILCVLLLSCESAIQTQQDEQGLEKRSKFIEQPLNHYNGQAYSEKPVVQQQERLINDLLDIYEGFGGLWIEPDDQEHIYIALAEQEDKNVNREAVVSDLTATVTDRLTPDHIPDAKKPEYRFTTKEVKYTFRELQHYRDLLTPNLHPREGVVYSYIDNSENQFIIGILEGTEKNEYNSLFK